MNRQRGFTAVELLLSTAFLSLVLLSGVVAARSATTVARDSIRTSAAEGRALRAQEQIRQILLAASNGSLEAVPEGGGPVEPMAEGVEYDNVHFRRVLSCGPAGQMLEPDVGVPPFSLAFQPRGPAGDEGDLVWTDERGGHAICGGIRAPRFVRTGSRISVRITAMTRDSSPGERTTVRSLVLRNP